MPKVILLSANIIKGSLPLMVGTLFEWGLARYLKGVIMESYLEKLLKLEPNPFNDNAKSYQVTYQLKSGRWILHENCNLWEAWYFCKTCFDLRRDVRVHDILSGRTFGTEIALLYLFSIGISGRYGFDRKSDEI